MTNASNDFEGFRVIVTAGASGIGRAIGDSFFDRGAVVHTIDLDRKLVEDMKTSCGEHRRYYSVADVASEDEVIECFHHQVTSCDGIDALINCAGIKGPTAPVEDILLQDWQRCLDVNLVATFVCSKQAIPLFKSQGSGSIINISSTAGWHGYPLRSPYAAAKWAVIGFTKSLAMELGPFGIRANAICPGTVEGERMDRVITDEARAKGVSEVDIRKQYTQGVSLRTMIQAKDIADTACFLASPAASKITGQFLSVDGHLEYVGGMDI